MAAPVITSITPPGPIQAPTGSTISVTVVAQDADARTETLQVTATDGEGNASQLAQVSLVWTDPVSISAKIKEAGSPSVVTVAGNVVSVAG